MPTVTWSGHEFTVCEHGADWSAASGLYIFAGSLTDETGIDRWKAFYVGQCQSFADRIPTHEKWLEALLLGATHVHALAMEQPEVRTVLERTLIEICQPPLNVQLR